MATIDAWPEQVTLRPVAGDPFAFRLILRDSDGQAVDVSLWDWAATVHTPRVRVHFEWSADEGGVRFWLRGDDTAQLSPFGKPWPFDVTGRQPTASEGTTVLGGQVITKARVTDPLRDDPELVPA